MRDAVGLAVLGARARRALAAGGHAERSGDAYVALARSGHPAFESAMILEAAADPTATAAQLADASRSGTLYVFCVAEGNDRLLEELRSHGGSLIDDEPWLWRRMSTGDTSEWQLPPAALIEGVEVHHLGAGEFDSVRSLLSDVFDVAPGPVGVGLCDAVLGGPDNGVIGLSVDEELIGAVTFERVERAVVIGELAVIPAARGAGCGTLLVSRALEVALEGGANFCAVQAAPDAVGVYQRLGFLLGGWVKVIRLG